MVAETGVSSYGLSSHLRKAGPSFGGEERGGGLTRSLVSAAVLTPTKGAVAKLALVLLLGCRRLLRRRVIRRI